MLETSLYSFPVLSCLVLIPVLGAAACLLMRHNDDLARWCALATGCAVLALSICRITSYNVCYTKLLRP